MILRRFALPFALLAAAGPAIAAESESKYTAEQDLRCATVILAFSAGKVEGDAQAGFGVGFAYFIGRWEVVTGGRFEDALTREYIEDTTANLTKYNKECGERLMRFGGRLQDLGRKLQSIATSKK